MAMKPKPAEITTDADDTLHEEPQHPQFAPGQKVAISTAACTRSSSRSGAVFVAGGGWFHPTKVYAAG